MTVIVTSVAEERGTYRIIDRVADIMGRMSQIRIYVASSNPGKLADFAAAAIAHNVDVLALPAMKHIEAPEETGQTFEENARLKAEFYSRHIPGEILIADDSGLVVDALGGEPGVRSARYAEYAGIVASDPDQANNQLLLKRADSVPDRQRQCAFVCAIAAACDGKTLQTFTARACGMLLREPVGSNGFGYDPLFYFPELSKSFAELSREQKLQISHRGTAFSMFLEWLHTIQESAAI
jgi:XTP/dITP diphosphohydrolase